MKQLLKENVDIKDYLKGVVKVYEGDKLIFKGHNMIVNTGRQFVKNIFEKNAFIDELDDSEDSSELEDYSSYKFYKAYFGRTGANNIITTGDMVLSDIKREQSETISQDSYISDYTKCLYNSTSLNDSAVITTFNGNRYMNISMELTGNYSGLNSISEIFLTFNKYENGSFSTEAGDEVLFSRFVMDPITLTANTDYRIEYYICF